MKAKAMYFVLFLVVFGLVVMGFFVAPAAVLGTEDKGQAELVATAEKVAIPTETNTTNEHNDVIEPAGTEGSDNTFYGNLAGSGSTAQYVTFIGARAGAGGNSGNHNTFLGHQSGQSNTSGESNSFVGSNAGVFNTGGSRNTFMGEAAGFFNTEGPDNSFFGYRAGYNTRTIEGASGDGNTFFGSEAGLNNATGDWNTFVGNMAGRDTKTIAGNPGYCNTFIGALAGQRNTTGDYNTFVGQFAGHHNQTGSGNVFIGNGAGANEFGSDRLFIDNSSTGYPLIWGDFDTRDVVIHGNFRAIAVATPSDARLKKNIKPLESSLDKISSLQGVSYEWNREDYPDAGMTVGKQIGLVAQDVEKEFPELVSEDKDGYKGVSYSKLTAVLVEAVKELKTENQREKDLLQEQLKKQQAEIEELRSMIKKLKS